MFDGLQSQWRVPLRVIGVAILACYIGIGILFYSLYTKWGLIDSIYFTIVTVTTCGEYCCCW